MVDKKGGKLGVQMKSDSEDQLPQFVAQVGNEHASFIQASYLVNGRVLTFRQPLTTMEDVGEALCRLNEEVAKAAKVK